MNADVSSPYPHESLRRRGFRSFLGAGSRRKRVGADYDLEERSTKPNQEPEAVNFGAGSTLLLTDGRPIEIEFDRSHSTSHYAEPSLDPRAEGIV